MRYIKPHYYDHFRCAADKCPDTCCAGWQIMIDEDSLEKYMQIGGGLGSRLANGIDWNDGSFLQYGGHCVMLNEDGLCDLVIEEGADSLCEACGRYPRHVEEYKGVREWSLSLSCPIAARMILECEEPVRFLIEEDETMEPLAEEFEDFDSFLFTRLENCREALFGIVQDRTIPMEQRLCSLLEIGEKLQECLDEDRLCDMDAVINTYEKIESGNNVGCHDGDEAWEKRRFLELQNQFSVFLRLEHLRDEWTDIIETAESALFTDFAAYQRIRQAFLAEYGPGESNHDRWEGLQENLLLFFLYTYFCGAVYDGWIYSKAALAVFSAVFITEFVMCGWYLADKNSSWQLCVETAYRYAREIEHLDDNLNLLEEWLQQIPLNLRGI